MLLFEYYEIKNNNFFFNKVLRLIYIYFLEIIYFLRSMDVMFNLTAHYKILFLNKDNSNAYGSRSVSVVFP